MLVMIFMLDIDLHSCDDLYAGDDFHAGDDLHAGDDFHAGDDLHAGDDCHADDSGHTVMQMMIVLLINNGLVASDSRYTCDGLYSMV